MELGSTLDFMFGGVPFAYRRSLSHLQYASVTGSDNFAYVESTSTPVERKAPSTLSGVRLFCVETLLRRFKAKFFVWSCRELWGATKPTQSLQTYGEEGRGPS